MPAPPQAVVSIASPGTSAKLSREQKAFNRLTRRVADLRRQLEEWQAMLPTFRSRHAAELQPLLERLRERKRALVDRCDALAVDPGLNRAERGRLEQWIRDMTFELLTEQDDPGLRVIHDRYADVGFEAQQREAAGHMKQMVEDMFGAPFGDDLDAGSPQDLMNHLDRLLDGDEEDGSQTPGAEEPDNSADPFVQPKARQAARNQAREARLRQEATQSLREVYRKLASALHPDREPDVTERARKSSLMQRVNAAYAGNDLLQLLELQVEAQQLGPADLSRLSNVRLKQYNKLLLEQVDELELELEGLEFSFDPACCLSGRRVKPAKVLKELDAEVAAVLAEIGRVDRDLGLLGSIAQVKRWLKGKSGPARRRLVRDPWDDDDSIPF